MRRGFTLVEMLIVMAILTMLMVMAVAVLNPLAQIAKGNDARRKNDLSLIKIAFEEYANDKGCYPTADVINGLTCNGNGFAEWGLNSWPCDPVSRAAYYIFVGTNPLCPSWFKILTNLNNKKDTQIPPGWYHSPSSYSAPLSSNLVNYGVSSSNVRWYDRD